MKSSHFRFHVIALLAVCIWGITFVSTKILLQNDLNPASIFFYRFLLAYLLISIISYKERRWAKSFKDEMLTLCLGVFGGSLYFLTENTALRYTLSTNVAFILCSAPLFTAILIGLADKMHKNRRSYKSKQQADKKDKPKIFTSIFVVGSGISIVGVAMIIFNGHFVLQLSPLGDMLCIAAALSWGFYTLVLKKLENKYSSLFLTRKVFFYGVLTILPSFVLGEPLCSPLKIIGNNVVLANMLFLGVIASLLCYLAWNKVVKEIGALKATNYIYLSPIFTSLASAFILREPITVISVIGAICIIFGVWISSRTKKLIEA